MDYDGSYHGLFSNVKLQSEIFERRQSDTIYYIETFNGDPVYLYLFLEFQSSSDRWMPVRTPPT